MSDAMSLAELEGQHVELLPARTVLSLFSVGDQGANGGHGDAGASGSSNGSYGEASYCY